MSKAKILIDEYNFCLCRYLRRYSPFYIVASAMLFAFVAVIPLHSQTSQAESKSTSLLQIPDLDLDDKLSLGGYADIIYSNYDSGTRKDNADLHRFVLYVGYTFNDWLSITSEFEVEHVEEIFIEFAHLNIELFPFMTWSLGLQAVPVGVLSAEHEPTTFYSATRSKSETFVIPSTWREQAVTLHGGVEIGEQNFDYQLGVFCGFDASKAKVDGSNWLRGARQKGASSNCNKQAYVGRIKYAPPVRGLFAAVAYYTGEMVYESAPEAVYSGLGIDLVSLYGQWDRGPFGIRALYTQGNMSEEDNQILNAALGGKIGKKAVAHYWEISYDLLALWDSLGLANRPRFLNDKKLVAYFRDEYVNTQAELAEGILRDDNVDVNEFKLYGYGLSFPLTPNVVLKLDMETVQAVNNKSPDVFEAQQIRFNRYNFAVGWVF